MTNRPKNDFSVFILRRACWIGRCSRPAVIEAFDISPSRASIALAQSVEDWPRVLEARPRLGVVRISSAQVPREASAETMFRLLESGAPSHVLGGELEEFGMTPTQPLVASRPAEGLDVILEAATQSRAQNWQVLEILYCGLKIGANAKWRTVVPNGLEYNNGQWRLLAIDLGSTKDIQLQQRTFVFPRIIRVKPGRWPKGLRKNDLYLASQGRVRRRIVLSPALTNDQKEALTREFGIHRGTIELYKRSEFEFRRMYTSDNSLIANDIVWPLIKELE